MTFYEQTLQKFRALTASSVQAIPPDFLIAQSALYFVDNSKQKVTKLLVQACMNYLGDSYISYLNQQTNLCTVYNIKSQKTCFSALGIYAYSNNLFLTKTDSVSYCFLDCMASSESSPSFIRGVGMQPLYKYSSLYLLRALESKDIWLFNTETLSAIRLDCLNKTMLGAVNKINTKKNYELFYILTYFGSALLTSADLLSSQTCIYFTSNYFFLLDAKSGVNLVFTHDLQEQPDTKILGIKADDVLINKHMIITQEKIIFCYNINGGI